MNQGQPNMYGTGVNTTYVPNQGMDEVVPALPAGQQGGGAWGGPATGGAWHTGPGRYAPVSADQHHMQHSQQAALQFTGVVIAFSICSTKRLATRSS